MSAEVPGVTPCTPGLDPERRTFRIERLTYEGTAWARAVVRSVRPRERVVIPFEDEDGEPDA